MTEGTAVASEVGGVETTINNASPVEATTTPDFQSIIPEEFADKPWVQDVKDIPGFFKMANDMKSELGKRAEASPAAPESVEGYELAAPSEGGEDFQKSVKEMFLKLGVSAEMAKGLDAGFNEITKGLAPDTEAQEKEFTEMTDKLFGDRADAVMKTAEKLLAENVPEGFADHVNKLDNKTMTILAAVLDKFQAKYISEDDLPRDGGAIVPAKSTEERRAQAKILVALPEASDKSHPGHAAVQLKIDKLYEGMS